MIKLKMKYCLLFFFGLIFFSCSKIQKNTIGGYYSQEKFADSLNIGLKGKTKVEIEKFRRGNDGDVFVKINFYTLKDIWVEAKGGTFHTWELKNRFQFEKDGITGLEVELKDFNNDGFKDLTYQSGVAGRGGNIIRTLFIYNPKERNFIHIRNSDNYPNLSYNSELKCINSVILTGSTTTVFLKIQKDSLDEFAKVDVSNKIRVKEKDSLEKFRVIEEKKFNGNQEDFYKVFRKYKPLEY